MKPLGYPCRVLLLSVGLDFCADILAAWNTQQTSLCLGVVKSVTVHGQEPSTWYSFYPRPPRGRALVDTASLKGRSHYGPHRSHGLDGLDLAATARQQVCGIHGMVRRTLVGLLGVPPAGICGNSSSGPASLWAMVMFKTFQSTNERWTRCDWCGRLDERVLSRESSLFGLTFFHTRRGVVSLTGALSPSIARVPSNRNPWPGSLLSDHPILQLLWASTLPTRLARWVVRKETFVHTHLAATRQGSLRGRRSVVSLFTLFALVVEGPLTQRTSRVLGL